MKQYHYRLLKQDGTIEDLGVGKKKDFQEIYKILDCRMIEIIPSDYWKDMGYGRSTMYGDEEGRFNEENHRNPHFRVLTSEIMYPSEWDVVGNILQETVAKEEK